MDKLREKLKKLKDLGFTKEQTLELLEAGTKEILENVTKEIQTQEKAVDYSQKNMEQLDNMLDQILSDLYGETEAENKKNELLGKYLQEIIDLTIETRNLYKRYAQGDEEAIKNIQEAQDDPEIKNIAKQITEE